MQPFASPAEYLQAELNRLDLVLHRQVYRLRAAHLLTEDPYRGLCIPDSHVDAILSTRRRESATDPGPPPTHTLSAATARAAEDIQRRTTLCRETGHEPPLCRLVRELGLTPFEHDTLLLTLAPELDAKYETLIAYVQNDVSRKRPTVDLALKLFSSGYDAQLNNRKHFAADQPLLRETLISLGGAEADLTFLSRPLKLDERIASFALGCDRIDARLTSFTHQGTSQTTLDDLILPETLANSLNRLAAAPTAKIILFVGNQGAGKRSAAEALCRAWETPLLLIDLRQLLSERSTCAQSFALLRREAILNRAALFFDHFELLLQSDESLATALSKLRRILCGLNTPVFLGSQESWRFDFDSQSLPIIVFQFPAAKSSDRTRLWRCATARHFNGQSNSLDLLSIADRFILTPGQIDQTIGAAKIIAASRPPGRSAISDEDLLAAAREISSEPLRNVARKVQPAFAWHDLILPDAPLRQLRDICTAVRHRALVFERWGFDRKLPLGKGLNALFAGPSGAGKTMAAQVIAGELALDLYQIDLSAVVSKYIGETEKNLSAIFTAAQNSNAILFFDEADALFGKRSEVKDALDRYANIEVAYLLQKIEDYDGIVILATNLGKNIDDAFRRRIRHTIEFPLPDAEHREKIWRRAFPVEAPLADDINFPFLARQFELAGGNIRNIALTSAFRAAEPAPECTSQMITMENIIVATSQELRKIGKLPCKSDFREYYEFIAGVS